MRENKFRVFASNSLVQNKMYYPGDTVQDVNGAEYFLVLNSSGSLLAVYPNAGSCYARIVMSDIEVMLWTGLLDQNGKEIYEGDIIEHWDERYVVPPFTPLDRHYQAENVKEHYDGSDDWMSMSNVDWQVIGNIYENPELLERE